MSEYESRERGRSHDRDVSYASPSHASNTPAPRTPAEQARDEISYAARVVNSIAGSLEAVRQAHAANDPARWREARGVVDRDLASAEKDLARARTRTHDAEPAAREQLALAEAALAQHVTAAASLVEAPLGWKPVAREAELLVILREPADGAVRSAFAHKEAELKAELARLSPAESHHLMVRLNKRIPGDPVAAAIALLVPERRARLVSFLGDARRRAALTKVPIVGAATLRSNAVPTTIELATTPSPSPTSTSTAAEPVSFETQVRQMIDARAPDLEVLAAIDGTKRRAMARQLEGYRAGSGDPLGARYVRLDHEVRQRFLEALLGSVTDGTHEQAAERDVDLTAVAEKGTRGAGERLPHLDRIQASFGSHDVTGIRAHVGGAAADATRQLGASGLAFGEHVAFASTPDLHTAAHEAAHYVQQRAGVALAGGIDQPGDEYERHADHVADAVVRGESAAGLLDLFAGRGSTATPARHAVQRKTGTGAQPAGRPDAHVYVEHHRAVLMNAIANRILDLGVPAPHEHLVWASREEGARAIANGIRSYVDEAPADPLHRLATLVTHDDLAAIVTWALQRSSDTPSVGFAIASAFDHPVLESVRRIGTRTRARMDAEHEMAEPSAAVTSSPLDRVVAQAMQGRVSGDALRSGQHGEMRGRELRNGAREVEYKWMGSRSPDLWNWIVVTSPHDATVEDVATTPLAGGNSTGTEQAYRIAASPPYFGIPFETARLVKEAVEHAPPALRASLDHDAGPRIADSAALAGNTASDGAAIAQAPKATNADLDPAHALSRLELELSTTQHALTPWQVDHPIGSALSFVARRRAELARSPSRATHWAPVLAAQERAVNAATSEVTTLVAKIPAAAANPHHPMAATLAAYARAIGVSHLASQALPALAEARHLREMLPLAIAEQQTADAGSRGAHVEAQVALDLATRAADLRAHAERDGKVHRAAINVLAADTQEATLNAQLGSLEHTLAELNAMADDAGITSSNYEHDLPTVRLAGAVLSKRIAGWRRQLDDAKHFKGPTAGHTGDETVVEQRRNTMTQITTSLANSIAEIQIDKYVEWARTTIHDQLVVQRIVKLVARLAGEIAIMIASMQIAGAAVAAVRGVMLGLEIAEDVRGASLAVRIVTSIAAAGVQTVGQGAIGGEVSMRAFAENAVALSTMTAITAPFEGLLAESASLEADLRTFAQKAVRSGSKVAIEAGAGYASSVMGQATANGYVANATGGDVLQQAFSLLVGKLVHQQTSAMTKRLDKAATVLGKQTVAAVRNKAAQLSERASKGKPTNEEALALLRDRVALLREEQALYKGHAELEHELASEPSLGGDFAAVPLTLAHLETVVEGHAYIGTSAEIDHAIKALDDTGIRAELVESTQGTRRYRVGDRTIEFRERDAKKAVAGSESGEVQRRPHPSDDHEYQFDAMRPGPLSDQTSYGDPKRTKQQVPAQGFYAGKYDQEILTKDTLFYRVGEGDRGWGQWWTDEPLKSEAQYRIDVAVKRQWTDPATGEMPGGSARPQDQLELWSYTAVIPKGTVLYSGPVGSQGGAHLGGPSTKQYFIRQAWKLESKGGAIVGKQRFKRNGHVHQPPTDKNEGL